MRYRNTHAAFFRELLLIAAPACHPAADVPKPRRMPMGLSAAIEEATWMTSPDAGQSPFVNFWVVKDRWHCAATIGAASRSDRNEKMIKPHPHNKLTNNVTNVLAS